MDTPATPPFIVIAGPCTLETPEVVEAVASVVADLAQRHPGVRFVFKGSFDKANRSSLDSSRGPGIERGLAMLADVKARFGLAVTTDIHLPEQADPVSKICDVLQIPAFLCRQTDLLLAAGRTGRIVNVKKGQFVAPEEMRHAATKLAKAGAGETWLTERGTTFGYGDLVVDMRSFSHLNATGHPAIFDATHSVQQPGRGAGVTGGQREMIPVLTRAAIAAGAQGLFVEAHPEPANAVSDAGSQLSLDGLGALVTEALKLHQFLTHSR